MAQIHYRKDSELPWRRVKWGEGFRYVNEDSKFVARSDVERISTLAIPPAWKDVVISPDPLDHIQAVGTDDRGRKQYIYHPEWTKWSQEHKFDQIISFGQHLPSLREIVSAHMREHDLTQNRILATIVWLLEHTFIRVGNKEYAQENKSYGLTTMRGKHVEVEGNTITFSFKGKSGVYHELDVTHPRVAKTIRACIELPGYEIFQYLDASGNHQAVDSADVNAYLQAHTGADFSAKDFRTWGGSVIAADGLYHKGLPATPTDLKINIADVVTSVSKHLGNTKKVCRTYYIHPVIIGAYENNTLVPHFEKSYKKRPSQRAGLTRGEYATWSLIKNK